MKKTVNSIQGLMKRLVLSMLALTGTSALFASEPITSVVLAFEDTTVYAGCILEIPFSYSPEEGDPETLVWETDNTDAMPNKNVINIFRPCEANITVSNKEGILATCHIKAIYRAQGQCGNNLFWSINNDYRLEFWADTFGGYKKTTTIPSFYDMWDYDTNTNPAPWTPYADKITDLYLYNVERIGNNAFRDMPNLYYAMLYDGISLGDSVFYGSTNLSTLEVRTSTPPVAGSTSLLLDKSSGKEVKVVIVLSEEDAGTFKADPIWGTAKRIITTSQGEWKIGSSTQIHWQVGQSDSLRSLKLQIDRSWELPYENKDPQIIPDMDTTSLLPPWHELRDNVEDLIIGDRISYIGRNAFASLTNIQTVQFRQMEDQLDSIHMDAFAHNIKPWKFALGDPQDGPIVPPTVVGLTGDWETVLAHFAEETVLYVPDSVFNYKGEEVHSVDLYKEAPFWSLFNRITDRTVAVDDVTDKSAVMTWLPLENACGYRLTIGKKDCVGCDTTIFIPALGGKGLIDWEHVDIPSYKSPRRQRNSDDGQGGMIVVLEIKKGSGSASNEDVEVSASALNASSDYFYTREVLFDNEFINQKLTKQGSFSTPEKPVVFTVTFTDKDGNTLKTEDVENGKAATAPEPEDIPVVEGYHFTGWDKAFDNITADLTIKAQYEIMTFSVKFFDKDGNQIGETQTVNWNEAAVAPSNPVWEGHIFTGWSAEFDHVKSDLEIKPVFNVETYSVTFLGFGDVELKKESVEYGKAATAPSAPEVTGYTFKNWDKEFNNITADLTVKAVYEINKYEVRFLDWNGAELKKEEVEHGSAATAPSDPTREGYTFTGWDKAFDNITADIAVTAQYEEVVVVDYTPQNLKAVIVPQDEDVLITLSWDKVDGAASYELRVVSGENELFSQNTMTLNVIASLLSTIEKEYLLTPGTFTIDWFVRSTDGEGSAISDWAQGESFEVTIKDTGTGIDAVNSQKPTANSQKILIDGVLYILQEGSMYDASGVKIQ